MRIQHNIAALNSYRNLGVNNSEVTKNLEKLSSGYKINRAGDDAAGLAISEKMRSQITGLNTATKNANDAISLVQTAEGALTEVHSMLNRMVEIATQSANGVYEDGVDRQALQDEMNALTSEIDRIADGTNFNKKNLLDGSLDTSNSSTLLDVGAVSGNDASTAKAGLNVKFSFDDAISGTTGFKISFGVATGDNKCTINENTGEIKIDVKKDLLAAGGLVAADIQKLITDAANSDQVTKSDVKDILSTVKVSGNGVIASAHAEKFDDGAKAVIQTQPAKTDAKALNLQIGDTNKDFNKLKLTIGDMHAEELGVHKEKVENGETTGISVETEDKAGAAVDKINQAINTVSTQRGKLGAIQNRLEHTINNLSVNAENMTAAESRIRDVDMADEMMKYTKNNILVQASQAMLAQANQVPQGVLQLLQ